MDILFTERLISEVKKRRCLWYADSNQQTHLSIYKSWKEIKAAIPEGTFLTVNDLKSKWTYLHDVFFSLHRQSEKQDPNKWIYYEQLKFLLEDPRSVELCLPKPEEEAKEGEAEASVVIVKGEWDEGNFEELSVEYERESELQMRAGAVEETDAETEQLSRKRRRDDDEASLGGASRSATSPVEQLRSQDYYFLMSLLPEMEKLPIQNRLRLRNKINSALLEEINEATVHGNESPLYC